MASFFFGSKLLTFAGYNDTSPAVESTHSPTAMRSGRVRTAAVTVPAGGSDGGKRWETVRMVKCIWICRYSIFWRRKTFHKHQETKPFRARPHHSFHKGMMEIDVHPPKITQIWMIGDPSPGPLTISTNSTVQGGGGSFKNRKPIGEVGCCESRMAERIHWWTDRWLELCFLECNGCSGHLTTTVGCSVV